MEESAMTNPITREPIARRVSRERSRWLLGHNLITFLAEAEDTEGRFSVLQNYGRKGGEPPPHTHTTEDESFYVIEGEVTVTVGGVVLPAPAGTWITVPRNTTHSYTIESPDVRMLTMFAPAGFERFFREMSEPAATLTLPPAPAGPPDVERLMAVAQKYGCRFP
jgi:quercetin dioxygenase-like cupin family protein